MNQPRDHEIFRAGEAVMTFLFNGFPEEAIGELTIQELLDRTKENDPAVIVEVNGRYVYRRDYAGHVIREGDKVEFIHPSFGG